MMPVTMSPSRPAYSSYFISRSASRMRCRMTCLAVCAAMRPKSAGVSSHSRTTLPSSSSSCAITRISPVSTSISTSASSAASGMRLYAVTSALASASSMISSEIPFSIANADRASSISGFFTRSLLCSHGPACSRSRLAGAPPTGTRLRAPLEDGARLRDVAVANLRALTVGLDRAVRRRRSRRALRARVRCRSRCGP